MMQHAGGPSLLEQLKLDSSHLLTSTTNCYTRTSSIRFRYITMRPATRFSGAVLRRAVRTPLRAQSPANAVTRAAAACQPLPSNATIARPFHSSIGLRSIMPDAENPPPKKSEEHDQPTAPAEISTEEFHERADAYLNDLVEKLEAAQEKDPQIEVEYSVWTRLINQSQDADMTRPVSSKSRSRRTATCSTSSLRTVRSGSAHPSLDQNASTGSWHKKASTRKRAVARVIGYI